MKIQKNKKGFTLIEVLIVIGIIAVLASIVVVAINPAKQFAQARNTQRQAHVESILNAIGQRMADNKGVFEGTFGTTPVYTCPTLPTSETHIFAIDNGNGTESVSGTNLSCLAPVYISLFPKDPSNASGNDTGYTIFSDTSGRVHVCAPAAALENSIPNAATICIVR